MKNVGENVPVIRFNGFSDAWEQRKLGNSIKVIDGDRGSNYPHDTDFFVNGNTLFLDTGNVTKNGFKFDSVKYITKEKDEQLRAGKLEKNDFVLTSRGTLGNVGFYNDLVYKIHPKIRINSAMLILRNTDEQLSYNYLHTLLKGKLISDFMKKNQVGSAQPHITKSEFLKLNLNVTCDIEEQNKIGDFFKSLDDTIALHQRKLDALKQLKKGFLQQMFPENDEKVPRVRFADFKEEWGQRKLGEVVNFFSGLTYSPNNVVSQNGAFVLRSSNVQSGGIVNADNVYVVSDVVNSENVQVGDIIVVVRNGSRDLIGKHAQIKEKMENTVIGAFMTGIRSRESNFINSLLDTQKFKIEINKNLGATINQITTGAFKKMTFSISKNISEQQKIGNFFRQLDNTINLQQDKLNQLKTIKKAYLQNMFI